MRVVLADRRHKVRFALRTLLQERAEVQVVGEVGERAGLLGEVAASGPDVLIVDWDLLAGDAGAAALIGAVRRACPHTRLVAMCGRPGVRSLALSAGADAFIDKSEPPEALEAVLRALEAGDPPARGAGTHGREPDPKG